MSWWDLVARAQMCRLVLFAYYDIPTTLDIPLKLHCNPTADRCQRLVWNDGSGLRKFICFEAIGASHSGLSTQALDEGDECGSDVASASDTSGHMSGMER